MCGEGGRDGAGGRGGGRAVIIRQLFLFDLSLAKEIKENKMWVRIYIAFPGAARC